MVTHIWEIPTPNFHALDKTSKSRFGFMVGLAWCSKIKVYSSLEFIVQDYFMFLAVMIEERIIKRTLLTPSTYTDLNADV